MGVEEAIIPGRYFLAQPGHRNLRPGSGRGWWRRSILGAALIVLARQPPHRPQGDRTGIEIRHERKTLKPAAMFLGRRPGYSIKADCPLVRRYGLAFEFQATACGRTSKEACAKE